MKTIVFVSVAFSICSACTPAKVPPVQNSVKVQSKCPVDQGTALKPPIEYVAGRSPFQETVANEMARLMAASNEQPLWCGDEITDGYRVYWLPAYRPSVVASVIKRNGAWQATGLEFQDPRHLPPSTMRPIEVARRLQAVPSEDYINRLDLSARTANAWTVLNWSDSTERMDGAVWILELRRDNSYRLISRVNVPDKNLEALSSLIISGTGIPVPDDMFVSR